MKFLNSGNIVRIPLDEVLVEGRLRDVREAFVENLILMAEDTGITTPIHVRKVQGRYVLIDGAHRLEAARRMGLSDIAALVVECRADEARAMEAASSSTMRMRFGFSAISATVARKSAPSRSLNTPALASSSRARPPLVGSFGIATRAPFGRSASDLCLRLNTPMTVSTVLPTGTKS